MQTSRLENWKQRKFDQSTKPVLPNDTELSYSNHDSELG